MAFAGVLAVSPDAMLLRSMQSLGASSADVAAAKYCGIFLLMVGLAAVKGIHTALISPGHLLAAACCQVGNQLCFTFSLLLTDPARALLLISLTPLWASVLGLVVLREPLPLRTRVAILLSVLSILVVFAPRLYPALEPLESDAAAPAATAAQPRPSLLAGDLLAAGVSAPRPNTPRDRTRCPDATDAVGEPHANGSCDAHRRAWQTGLAQAGFLTVNRHAALHAPRADLTLATGFSTVVAFAAVIALPCDPADEKSFWACTPPVWRSFAFLSYALADALCVACLYAAMILAPRHLSGSEVALVMLLEDLLGPLWVFVRFGDRPSVWTVAGGALLLATLIGHECIGWRSDRRGDVHTEQRPRSGRHHGASMALPFAGSGADDEGGERPYHRITNGA